MYLTLIITFLLLIAIIVPGVQNSTPLEVKFFIWQFQLSLTGLIVYASIAGGAVVAVLSLPKLATKSLKVRSLKKEIARFEKKISGMEKPRPDEGRSA